MSDCDPQRRQPTRLCRPWDSPGKNTGADCHFLFQCRKVKVKVKSLRHVRLLATPWTAAYQAPLSMGFSRHYARHWEFRNQHLFPVWSLASCQFFLQIVFHFGFFPPIFFAFAIIHSIITTCVNHCNNQLVPKLFFGIYVSAKLIVVLRCGTVWGFPGGSVVKKPPAGAGAAGDSGLITEWGRSPGGGNGYPLKYPCGIIP